VSLTVLSVAFPFSPVGRDAVGGSEQVLSHLDEALARAGHHNIVVACEGSTTCGTLVPVPRVEGIIDEAAKRRAQRRHGQAIREALDRWPVDLIHMHAFDFHAYMPPAGVPLLATLHLPPDWYPKGTLNPSRPDTWLHCVSAASHAACPPSPALLDPIENGVPVEELAAARHAKRNFALFLGRICWEKGPTIAIEAAKLAGIPLLIAGEVAHYKAHQDFFTQQMSPTLDEKRRFIGPIGFERKRRLLTAARCLLVPSLAPETSSLVAREALACGTPVIAFPRGALGQTIEHGRTGYLVGSESIHEMAEAIAGIDQIDPEICRAEARRRFSLETMVSRYLATYERLAASGRNADRLTAAE
jgi:glycosyltransferase involved in cell wall biosynthesis